MLIIQCVLRIINIFIKKRLKEITHIIVVNSVSNIIWYIKPFYKQSFGCFHIDKILIFNKLLPSHITPQD